MSTPTDSSPTPSSAAPITESGGKTAPTATATSIQTAPVATDPTQTAPMATAPTQTQTAPMVTAPAPTAPMVTAQPAFTTEANPDTKTAAGDNTGQSTLADDKNKPAATATSDIKGGLADDKEKPGDDKDRMAKYYPVQNTVTATNQPPPPTNPSEVVQNKVSASTNQQPPTDTKTAEGDNTAQSTLAANKHVAVASDLLAILAEKKPAATVTSDNKEDILAILEKPATTTHKKKPTAASKPQIQRSFNEKIKMLEAYQGATTEHHKKLAKKHGYNLVTYQCMMRRYTIKQEQMKAMISCGRGQETQLRSSSQTSQRRGENPATAKGGNTSSTPFMDHSGRHKGMNTNKYGVDAVATKKLPF